MYLCASIISIQFSVVVVFTFRYPWGQEAFSKAKSEDKPIFLSGKHTACTIKLFCNLFIIKLVVFCFVTVGYSTCHWCHVMERESFEDEEIGKILSDNFVCIKVDREERPDVDKVYMTFVQVWFILKKITCPDTNILTNISSLFFFEYAGQASLLFTI